MLTTVLPCSVMSSFHNLGWSFFLSDQRERQLGMLLERHDEWPEGSEMRSERAVVKMVVDNDPAQVRDQGICNM